jgi:ribosome-associated translation inhibitor RaiA/cold shock CspA family protein
MQVEPQITFKGLETSPALEALIRRRIDKLGRKHPRITRCRVVVEAAHRGTRSPKVPLSVCVEVEVPGRNTIVAKDGQQRHEMKDDYTAALNNAFDAAERQLAKLNAIQDGDVKASEAAPQSGMIVRLFPDENYGFIELDNSPELHFTRNAVVGGNFDELRVGMLVQVTRATGEGPMGPQASTVRLLDRAQTPE